MAASAPVSTDQTLSILLIEDDADTRANLCDILEIDGHRVQTATHAVQARSMASGERFEIIILDRKLPDATADELLPELVGLNPQAHIIVMTGFANLNSTISAFRAGAADYIIKPVSIDALRNSLQHIQRTRNVEKQLRQKQEFANLILNTADAIILVLDLNGRVIQVNDYFQRITGWAPNEVVGQNWFNQCIPEYERERIEEVFILTAQESHSRGIVNSVLTKSGNERQIRWSNNTLNDDSGKTTAVLAVGIDITDHIAAEQQLLQAERLAGIGQTMAAIAHESRNGLQRIQAGVEMLQEITRQIPDAAMDLRVIKRAANDLNYLFEEVRSFAAPINVHLSQINIVETMKTVWNKVIQASGRLDASCEEDLTSEEILIHADAFRMEQVFRNLFENSLFACPHNAKVHLQAWIEDSHCRLIVSDNGPGLSKEQQIRIFEPFFTTKAKGTGLGMAIVKRIISAHQGTIGILPQTANRTGARFEIRLPIKPSRNRLPA